MNIAARTVHPKTGSLTGCRDFITRRQKRRWRAVPTENDSSRNASKLVKAIDDLLSFVNERLPKKVGPSIQLYFLDQSESVRLFELEGKIVALHPRIADGKLPFRPETRDPGKSRHHHFTSGTGLEYSIGGSRGIQLHPSFHWSAELASLRAAAQAIVVLDMDDGEEVKTVDSKKARRRGRPVEMDAKADKRLCADWKAAKGQGMRRADFARARGIKVQDIIAAQDREQYRRKRDEE
jgi:hypothetical protein